MGVDISTLGAIATKGLFLAEREGHPPPRIVETPAGMLNAIGLQGIGARRFVDEKLPALRQLKMGLPALQSHSFERLAAEHDQLVGCCMQAAALKFGLLASDFRY